MVLKNEFMACYEPAVQVHSCCLSDPRDKVDRNFDNVFQLVDLCLANETKFEKTKHKIQVAVKDKNLTRSELLINVFFKDRLKPAVIKLFLQKYIRFFLLIFISLSIFPYFNTKYVKLIYLSISFFKTEFYFEFFFRKVMSCCVDVMYGKFPYR